MGLTLKLNTRPGEVFPPDGTYRFEPIDQTKTESITSVFVWLVYERKTIADMFLNDDGELLLRSDAFKEGFLEISHVEQCNGLTTATLKCEFETNSGKRVFGSYDGIVEIVYDIP